MSTEPKALAIHGHLAECPYCAAELDALEQFLTESELPPDGRAGHEDRIHK